MPQATDRIESTKAGRILASTMSGKERLLCHDGVRQCKRHDQEQNIFNKKRGGGKQRWRGHSAPGGPVSCKKVVSHDYGKQQQAQRNGTDPSPFVRIVKLQVRGKQDEECCG